MNNVLPPGRSSYQVSKCMGFTCSCFWSNKGIGGEMMTLSLFETSLLDVVSLKQYTRA